jgi:hypothetical protein
MKPHDQKLTPHFAISCITHSTALSDTSRDHVSGPGGRKLPLN